MKTKSYSRIIFVILLGIASVAAALCLFCSCTFSGGKEGMEDGHIILNCSFDYLTAGESRRYYAKQSPSSVDYVLVWESSDESVATVDKDGNVSALVGGKTRIRVRAEGKPYRAEMELTVADVAVGAEEGKQALQSAVDNVKNNGVVLITGGYFDGIEVDKRLTIKGAGDAAVAGITIVDDAQLFAESVAIYATSASGDDACVHVGENASFTAVGCTFFYDDPSGSSKSETAIDAPCDASGIYCRACSFNGYSECVAIGATDGDIYIVNNDFSDAETAVCVDLRRSNVGEDGRATGKVADNVYIDCSECVKLLFNALSYTGTLEIPDSEVSVPH